MRGLVKTNIDKSTLLIVALALIAGALFLSGHKAFAATYNVTTSSACTLPDAITASDTNAVSGSCAAGDASNTINLAAGTYTLAADLPAITANNLTVNGAGSEKTIIDGSNTYSMFDISGSGLNSAFSNFTTIGVGGVNPTWYSIYDGDANGTLDISNVVLRDSTAGGGVFVSEPGFITDSAIENVRGPNGGEVMFDDFGSGTFNITNSTVANSDFTTGIWINTRFAGTINIFNDTITGNTGTAGAAGVQVWDTNNGPGTVVNLENTILSNNVLDTNPTTPDNCSDATYASFPSQLPTSLGHNISDDNTCTAAFTQTGDRNNTDPQLGPLTLSDDTYVFPISASSPAHGAADPLTSLATDQRGVARPQCGNYDVGAYELAIAVCPSSSNVASANTVGTPDTGFGVNNTNPTTTLLAYSLVAASMFGLAYSARRLSRKN